MTRKHPNSRLKTSNREDGRGHYPPGVPRCPLDRRVLPALRNATRTMTLRVIGVHLGTDGSTVSKWLKGKQRPCPEFQAKILERFGASL